MNDIAKIVALLADDALGQGRENAELPLYEQALAQIIAAENNEFYLAIVDHEIVGCFQLTFIPNLSRGASKRAQIESVRVKSKLRGQGIGATMVRWAIEHSRNNGCVLMQLTTDKRRDKAHDFYLNLGFEPSHIGMKLELGN